MSASAELRGASPAEWDHWRNRLNLGAHLVPVVTDPDAPIAPTSSLTKVGKAVSAYDADNFVWGVLKWTETSATSEKLDRWSSDARHAFGVQSRAIRALDVDIEDPALAAQVEAFIAEYLFTFPKRTRANSSKFLLAFRLEGEYRKTVIKTRAGAIEFLADGQMFVAAGTHPSGARIEWEGGAPTEFPLLSADEFSDLWRALGQQFAVEPPRNVEQRERQRTADEVATFDENELRELFRRLKADPDDYHEWVQAGLAAHSASGGEEYGFEIWDAWSQRSSKYPDSETLAAKWNGFRGDGGITAGWLLQRQQALDEDFGDPPADDDAFAQAQAKAAAERQATLVARWKWTPLPDFAKRSSVSWLIRGVLPFEELNMLYGPSGAGKSFVAFDMALSIARGGKWRDRVVRQGAVGWIAAEAEGSIPNRYRAYCMANDLDVTDVENFHVLGAGVNLSDPELMESLGLSARPFHPVLIVVDTLAAASAGANENSGEHMGRVLDSCRRIHRITGAAVLLVHHSGKNEELGARGWSGIKAAVHAELSVSKRDDELREITITKLRDGIEGLAFAFKLREVVVGHYEAEGEDVDPVPVKSAVVEHVDSLVAMRRGKKKTQGKWHRAIREALAAASDQRLPDDDLFVAVLGNVPEDKHTAYPRKRYNEALATMRARKEIVLAADHFYEFAPEIDVPGSPDNKEEQP